MRFDGAPVDRTRVVSMRDQLVHRGPDASGLYVSPDSRAAFGFRRLKIVDLSDEANQPLANEDGTIWVVFNGEVYNFLELRAQLLARGHQFRSQSDTEVIVHLYEDHGLDCVDRLDGMFAIAVWDERRRRLLLARDRAGKKPLFYTRTDTRLMFASEIKAFFGRADVDLRVDPHAVPQYFVHGFVPCPATPYRGVHQVEPGTILVAESTGAVSTRRYWTLKQGSAGPLPTRGPTPSEARATVRRLLTRAVERRLIADVPIGAFLSGGLDSTIVVGLMSQLMGRRVQTFSIGFKGSTDYDETAYARMAAARFGTDHTEFIVEPGAFDLLEKLVWHHDGPFGDSSAVPTYLVSELTRRRATVVLTGDGGDDVFAGYLRFYATLAAERIPSVIRASLQRFGRHVSPGPTARHLRSRIHRFAAAAGLPMAERLTRWSGVFFDDIDALLSPDFRAEVGAIDRMAYLRRFAPLLDGCTPLGQILTINAHAYLVDDLLVKTDRCTMANALEARSPFLDTAVVEYAATLADSLKLSRGRTKRVLREAFEDLVPTPIQRRPKMGFGVPFGVWFRGALRDALHDHLLSPTARYREYLSPAYVHQLVRRHDAGHADLGLPLWTVLSFEVWLRSLPRWIGHGALAAAHDRSA